MASHKHGSFHAELSRFLQAHSTDADRFLVRSALMWLSVAQRPLRAHELWIALQVGESGVIEHIEHLLTGTAYSLEQKAASSLRDLLGGLITLSEDAGDPNAIHVTLCDTELQPYLSDMAIEEEDSVLSLAFPTAQAHFVAARVCMAICSVTTLHMAYAHGDTGASSLMLYSWSHWTTHLSLSGYTLADDNAAGPADTMISGVSTDVLVLLLSLNDLITGPLTFPSALSRLECVANIRQVQKALEQPMLLVSAIVRQEGYAAALQGARRVFEAAKHPHTSTSPRKDDSREERSHRRLRVEDSRLLVNRPATRSKEETLDIDKLLADTEALFGETERLVVRSFAEVARGLRSICVALSAPALYTQLLRQYDGDWSPVDVLVNAANWMEAVASYPYWGRIPDGASPVTSDTSDVNYDAARLVLKRGRPVGSSSLSRRPDGSSSTKPPAGISAARWYAATAVERVRNLGSPTSPGPTFTINDIQSVSHRPSSFASLPPQIYAPRNPLRSLSPFIPHAFLRLCRRRVAPLLRAITSSGLVRSVGRFDSGAFEPGDFSDNWPQLKSALLADGYRAAAVYIGIAILLNHVRRILLPWLATYMFYNPMEDLRLVRSRPDVFLDQALAFSWSWFVLSYAQKYACDILGGLFMGVLIFNSDSATPRPGPFPGGGSSWPPGHFPERLLQAVRVGYVLWVLATVDYIFARAVNTISFLTAIWRLLLSGGDAERIVLGRVLRAHWPKLPLVASQVYVHAAHGLLPTSRASVLRALAGQPGLLLLLLSVAGGADATIRYRARLYIALELAGMFVVLGLAAAAAALLAAEFVADPLGLAAGTAAARRRAAMLRAALPRGADARGARIFAGKGSSAG